MAAPILILGGNGQVGWELQRSLSVLGPVVALTRAELDLVSVDAMQSVIQRYAPCAIVNAAAYTAVDKAETERELAWAINAKTPALLAKLAASASIPLIHYSTDYVYAGDKSDAYIESDATNPLSNYGSSKLAGDEAVLSSSAQAVVLRTSWVYAKRGANFLKTILRLAGERDALRIVADQRGAPTSAMLLADVAAHVLHRMRSDPACRGLFHCTAAGDTTWHGYAQYIVEQALALGLPLKATPQAIAAITTADYPTPAQRPANSRLNCGALEQQFGLQLPPWQAHVTRTLQELIP
jgi:dTDP-4-dehydrorhamnose reductase